MSSRLLSSPSSTASSTLLSNSSLPRVQHDRDHLSSSSLSNNGNGKNNKQGVVENMNMNINTSNLESIDVSIDSNNGRGIGKGNNLLSHSPISLNNEILAATISPSARSASSGQSISSPISSNTRPEVDVFWGSFQGSTKIVASTVHASKAKNGSHTVYTIDVRVYFDDELGRHWQVLRRYSDYDKLHRALKECGFPCPELPPKHLWSFHTHTFIEERRHALDLWIQGTLCIWQSVSPAQPAQAFEVGDLLEAFLCDIDTERFSASVDHVLSGVTTDIDFGTSPQTFGTSFASLARAKKKNQVVKIPATIEEEIRSSLPSTKAGITSGILNNEILMSSPRRSRSSNDLASTFIHEASAANESIPNSDFDLSQQQMLSDPTENHITENILPSSTIGLGSSSSRSSLFKNASVNDLPSMMIRSVDEPSSQNITKSGPVAVSANVMAPEISRDIITKDNLASSDTKDILSRSVPTNSLEDVNERMDQMNEKNNNNNKSKRKRTLPSPQGDVGVEIISQTLEGISPTVRNYTTYDHEGQKIMHSFKPFTTTVVFRGDASQQTNIAGLPDASTPVSVPPTPFGQGEFFQSWAQYTNSVLDFVAQRLDQVSTRRTNIFDQVSDNASPQHGSMTSKSDGAKMMNEHMSQNIIIDAVTIASTATDASTIQNNNATAHAASEGEDNDSDSLFDDQVDKIQNAVASTTIKSETSPETGPISLKIGERSSNTTSVPTQQVHRGVNLLPQRTPQEEALYRSYLSAGERLVGIIMKECESAIDPLGTDWEFIANTKNVIVMKRKKAIRRRYFRAIPSNTGALSASEHGVPPSPESVSTNRSVSSSQPSSSRHLLYQSGNEYIPEEGATVTSTSSAAGMTTPIRPTIIPDDRRKTPTSETSSSSRQYCFMGRGVINASASEIFEVVRRPQTRISYDRMLKEEVILENIQTVFVRNSQGSSVSFAKLASDASPGDVMIDVNALGSELSESHFSVSTADAETTSKKSRSVPEVNASDIKNDRHSTESIKNNGESSTSFKTGASSSSSATSLIPDFASPIGDLLVYYHLFETNRCFVRYSRDFCVMQYAKGLVSNKPNKYIVVGTSVPHSDCPFREDVVRATLPIFGWVIEAVSKNQSKVSYIIQLDFGGSVSTQLLNTISFRQPLCVHYLGKYMAELKEAEKQKSLSPILSSTTASTLTS